MNIRPFLFAFKILVILLLGANCSNVKFVEPEFLYRPPAKTIEKQGLQIDNNVSYWVTSDNFDKDGHEDELRGDERFDKVEAQTMMRYGLNHLFQIHGGLRYRRNYAVVNDTNDNNRRITLSEEGLESVFMGAVLGFKSTDDWRFSLDASVKVSTYDNPPFDVNNPFAFVVLGDENTELMFGGNVAYKHSGLFTFSGSIHLNVPDRDRDRDLSNELIFDGHGVWTFKRVALLLGLEYVHSLRTERFSNTPEQKPEIGTATTNLFNSVNRSWFAPYAGFRVGLTNNWRFDFTVRSQVEGISTDKGVEFIGGIVWRKEGFTRKDQFVASFKNYSIEASVIKVSPRGKFVKIDNGIAGDFEKGLRVDIYDTDYFGGNILVASGIVYEATANTAIIKVDRVFRNDVRVKIGFTARAAFK